MARYADGRLAGSRRALGGRPLTATSERFDALVAVPFPFSAFPLLFFSARDAAVELDRVDLSRKGSECHKPNHGGLSAGVRRRYFHTLARVVRRPANPFARSPAMALSPQKVNRSGLL